MSSIALDLLLCSNKWVMSGSFDASVKLWKIGGNPSDDAASGAMNSNTASMIGNRPAAEFFDHESAVLCVAIDEYGRLGAAGAEDGQLVVWDLRVKNVLFSYPASPGRKYVPCSINCSTIVMNLFIILLLHRAIKCVKWLNGSSSNSGGGSYYQGVGSFSDDKLICASADGMLLCLDRAGKLFAATQLESGSTSTTGAIVAVYCVESDSRLIYGGCTDGTIRCWLMQSGAMIEVYRQTAAHSGPVLSLSLTMHVQDQGISRGDQDVGAIGGSGSKYSVAHFTALLVSTGEDCTVRVWRIHCAGDY